MYNTPLAYFITFTCYGIWLHGDPRGFVYKQTGIQPSNPFIFRQSQEKLKYPPMFLSPEARTIIDVAVRQLAEQRQWKIHELNVRSNHVHTVITASGETPEKVMADIKAKATRVLRENNIVDKARKVWTEHGSTIYIFNEEHFDNACRYVKEQ